MSIFERLPKLDETMRAAIVRALIYIGVIISLGYLAQQSNLFGPSEPVTVRMDMPSTLTLPGNGSALPVQVTVRLINNTKEVINLEAATSCNIFRWFIASTNGEFIQSEGDRNCVQAVVTATLPARETYEEKMELAFDSGRMQPDGRYHLVFQFWGKDGQTKFETQAE